MEKLEHFINRIEKFDDISSSEKIKYFSYFLIYECSQSYIQAKQIEDCFITLNIKPYSNIGSFLLNKSKGKTHIFLKYPKGYALERKEKENIEKELGVFKKQNITDNYFPFSLVQNTRKYIEKIAEEAISCYDYGLYDACLILTRRLVETLIIELYEKRGLENNIKNTQGHYPFLSDLIVKLLSEATWTIGRNAQQGLAPIKKLGDLSAHNRRFLATKSDIDKVKTDIRIVIEELIHLIDF